MKEYIGEGQKKKPKAKNINPNKNSPFGYPYIPTSKN